MPERIPVRSVRTGGLDYLEVPSKDEAMVASLLRERDGYIARGLIDRIAAVDAELARFLPAAEGAEPCPESKPSSPAEPATPRARRSSARSSKPASP